MTTPEAYHRARIASDKIHDHTIAPRISLPPTRAGAPPRATAAGGPIEPKRHGCADLCCSV
jgi:hypothetical protein